MPDFLTTSLSGSQTNPPALIVWHIGTALILGLAVAWLYRGARRGSACDRSRATRNRRSVASSAINTAARFAMACCLFFGSLAR
jgi:hypothetical protein